MLEILRLCLQSGFMDRRIKSGDDAVRGVRGGRIRCAPACWAKQNKLIPGLKSGLIFDPLGSPNDTVDRGV
jgi:hypothetical protein